GRRGAPPQPDRARRGGGSPGARPCRRGGGARLCARTRHRLPRARGDRRRHSTDRRRMVDRRVSAGRGAERGGPLRRGAGARAVMSEEQEPPVAGAAPTATTTPVAPEPKRRRRWLVAAALLLAAGVAALLLLLRRGGPDTEAFRVRSEEVLGSLRDGKAEEVYEGASFRFKQTLLVDKFVDLVDRMNRTMGRFERVIDVVDVDQAVTVAGMTARVELELEYEKAETTGELSFHRGDDGAWRLLGLSVRIPEELEETAASLERQVERVRAPE